MELPLEQQSGCTLEGDTCEGFGGRCVRLRLVSRKSSTARNVEKARRFSVGSDPAIITMTAKSSFSHNSAQQNSAVHSRFRQHWSHRASTQGLGSTAVLVRLLCEAILGLN